MSSATAFLAQASSTRSLPAAAAAVAAIGVILAAAYLLWMFQRVLFNDRGDAEVMPAVRLRDFSAREIASVVPLVVFAVWVGVYPEAFLNLLHLPVQQILDMVTPALGNGHSHGLADLFHVTRGLF